MIKEVSKNRSPIFSSIDVTRFKGEVIPGIYYIKLNNVKDYIDLIHVLSQLFTETANEQVFLHLSGVKEPLIYLLEKIQRMHSKKIINMLIYDFGKIPGFHKIPRTLKLTVDSNLGSVLTTSYCTYIQHGKYLRMHYMPFPIIPLDNLYVMSSRTKCNFQLINDSLYRITYLGHLYEFRFPYKTVLKSIYKLINSGYKDLELLILSPKTTYNSKMVKVIKNYSKQLGIRRSVSAFSEDICEKCKYELLKRSDIFLFLPTMQPVSMDPPVSVLEAMFSGNVVLSSLYMSLKYIIRDGVNGMIIDNMTTDVLYEKLKMLLTRDDLREFISQNAKSYLFINHYYSNVIKMLRNILEGKLHV
jgi:glycosyltransferase involved in cell wall biosynthesis